jgi:ketosteroid isomerase-like protein
MESSPSAVVAEFIRMINAHDVRGLTALMTDDHRFIDSLGNVVKGKDDMRKAWIGYFYFFPDYTLDYSLMMEEGDTVAVFATARGTYAVEGKLLKENSWTIPAACKATVRSGKVAEWQVYADNEPVRTIMTALG